jgi:peptidoglycan L-alanyl-D-glutamate endopeptidase CwlK
MENYNRDPKYLHPILRNKLTAMIEAIQAKLPSGISVRVISIHRTPSEQFEIFKKGRSFIGGKWIVVGTTFTKIDGIATKSRHNYLPSTAVDFGLFDAQGKYLGESPHYNWIGEGAKVAGLTWGGNWTGFVDKPHIEIPVSKFFGSIEKDNGLLWQKYLQMDGSYTKSMDGLFGPGSIEALYQSTGERERNVKAWDILWAKHGAQ